MQIIVNTTESTFPTTLLCPIPKLNCNFFLTLSLIYSRMEKNPTGNEFYDAKHFKVGCSSDGFNPVIWRDKFF